MAGGLTPEEEARLLAAVDRHKREDYDKEFYSELQKIQEPHVGELDDRIRRAIGRYIEKAAADLMREGEHPSGAYMMEGWILGYMAAKKIKTSIFKKVK